MTDKQIIYDCPHISFTDWGAYACRLYEPRDKNCLVEHGTCASNVSCPYKQAKRKEQECEMWKNLTIDNGAVALKYQEQLDRLKEANEDLLSVQYELADNNKRLRQAIEKIKEIAENGKRFAERYMITGEQKANVLTYANAILQICDEVISE